MKIYFNSGKLIFFLLVTLLSCKKEKNIDFRDPTKAECLLDQIIRDTDTTVFYYDENKKVAKIEWLTSGYMEITYNDEGQIIQTDEFYSEIKEYYTTYTWNNSQLEAIYYQLNEGNWLGKYKNIIEYNGNKEIIKITDYSIDALGTTWLEDGDYYVFEWQDGNLMKAENWDNYSTPSVKKAGSSTNHSLIKTARSVYKFKNALDTRDDGFNIFSTTNFEYDAKTNPFRYLTSGNVIAPDEFNISKNNWTKKIYSDLNGKQVESTYSYELNEKNFPVKLNMVEERIFESGSITTNIVESYVYNCN